MARGRRLPGRRAIVIVEESEDLRELDYRNGLARRTCLREMPMAMVGTVIAGGPPVLQ